MRLWPRRRVYVDSLPKTHDVRFLVIFLAVLVASLGAVYVVGYVAAGDKVPPHTSVAGVDIGSLSRHEAETKLAATFTPRLHQPVTVTAASHSMTLTPSEAGVTFDLDATIDAAMDGADWNPSHMLQVVEGGSAIDPVFRADPAALEAALAPLATKVERGAVDSDVGIRAGRAVVQPGHDGRRLEIDRAAASVMTAMERQSDRVRLHLTTLHPTIDLTAATMFADHTLQPALARGVVISVAGHQVRVPATDFAPALRVTEHDGRLHLGAVPKLLWLHTRGALASMPGRPVDARIVFRDAHPTIVAGHAGDKVTEDAWTRAVFTAVQRSSRRAFAPATTVQPDRSTADVRALDIKTRVSEADARAHARMAGALGIATRHLDAALVLPGASFSYVRQVGQASTRTVLGALGRATQSAAERAHLTITQWPLISPAGHDLGFRNTTEHPVLLHAWVTPPKSGLSTVHVQFWAPASP